MVSSTREWETESKKVSSFFLGPPQLHILVALQTVEHIPFEVVRSEEFEEYTSIVVSVLKSCDLLKCSSDQWKKVICIQIKPDLSICDSFKQRIKYIMMHKIRHKTLPGVRTIERCTESMGIGYGTQRQYLSIWRSCFVHCCVSAVGLVFSLQLNSQPIPDKNGTAKHYLTVDCLHTAHLLYLQRLLQMLVLSLFTLSSHICYQSQSQGYTVLNLDKHET